MGSVARTLVVLCGLCFVNSGYVENHEMRRSPNPLDQDFGACWKSGHVGGDLDQLKKRNDSSLRQLAGETPVCYWLAKIRMQEASAREQTRGN